MIVYSVEIIQSDELYQKRGFPYSIKVSKNDILYPKQKKLYFYEFRTLKEAEKKVKYYQKFIKK